ncbi:hypothetical protein ACH4KN_33305 [Streptomyces sp. NPDC017546]|uniref:hypothetical protein n=1 Tax=Streptomyces sp. NPDC017546 TaxID=3365001 RepID=UPI0037B20F77
MSTPGFGPPPGDFPPRPPYAPPPYGGQAPPPYGGHAPQPYGSQAPPPYGGQAAPLAPEFVAFDKSNALVIDDQGVSFDIGGHVTDYPWQQITQLHYTARGTFLRVGLIHPNGWFVECVINAKKQQKLIQWLTELGPVAAHYQAQLAS